MEQVAGNLKSIIVRNNVQLLVGLIAVAVTVLTTFSLQRSMKTDLPESRIDIEKALHTSTVTDAPPSEIEYGSSITLGNTPPTDPYLSARQVQNRWYTVLLDLEVPPNRLWGIYLPAVSSGAQVFLNGAILGTIPGSQSTPSVRSGLTVKAYLNIPNGLLTSGRNEVQINTRGVGITNPGLYREHGHST